MTLQRIIQRLILQRIIKLLFCNTVSLQFMGPQDALSYRCFAQDCNDDIGMSSSFHLKRGEWKESWVWTNEFLWNHKSLRVLQKR